MGTEAYMATWSGGKDSCLALARALAEGRGVTHLLHFARDMDAHGVPPELVRLQASLTGLELVQEHVAASDDFETRFKEAVRGVPGTGGMVFGDIYLREHRDWLERVCNEAGVRPHFPLWGDGTEALLREFLDAGFETVVVSGRAGLIERQWIGRKVDEEFLGYARDRGIDPCGEKGEFHTFVTGGPLFRGRIRINGGAVTERDGHLFYVIDDYEAIRPPLAVQKGL